MPIFLRIIVAGKRAELATGRACDPSCWNSSAGRAAGTKAFSKSLNAYLDSLQVKVYEAHRQLVETLGLVTATALKNRVIGKEERRVTLIEVFQDHNRKMKALVGDEFARGTLGRYTISLKHTVDFLEWKYQAPDIDIRKVNHAFITEYEFYLRSVRKCSNNTAVKYIKNFGKIIRICLANGWLSANPFVNYKAKMRKVDRVFLTEEELKMMAAKELVGERLLQVRDIFLFSCFTGLAYADVLKLIRADISKGIDGKQWVFKKRQKTDTISRIPLLPMALRILEKYKDHPQCLNDGKLLPVLSNQKMNAYLKEIADLCGINKPLTFHIARHTFATTVTLLNGVPLESMSKMLGHSNLSTMPRFWM
ncbi:site-specific recombinase XerD [Pontibacter ummariensis]|uniref:Site-specific recombinase XerD n=1 Tax=Pontibacter ummariensis TaxID=1610492 RepID=A0A239LEA6_9BACT|nr:site-specific integrase [Pontibacter ummariensis]PRY03663.1 site-specific recombinase XerD [Pontibacter ummariensis]SNT28238.1 Site-specific recombinase XerD [Pontibacter ummariensis]